MYGFHGLATFVKCNCGKILPLKVLRSPAGYYLGYFCNNCGPEGRETEYMEREQAKKILERILLKQDKL